MAPNEPNKPSPVKAIDASKSSPSNPTPSKVGEPNTNGPTDTNGSPDVNSNTNLRSTESSNNPSSMNTSGPTDSNGTPGFESPTPREPNQLGPDRPGFQPDTNDMRSTDLAEGDSFRDKEKNHPHASPFTPNTTMSGGPFANDTYDNRLRANEATVDNNVPVKTYVRHPFEAAGNLAGVTPVQVEDKELSEREVDQRIAQVLKDGGMDSASQLRSFAQIKVILNAWKPLDSDVAITRETVLREQKRTNDEINEQLKTDEQRDKDAATVANLKKSMLSGQGATTNASR